MMMMSNTQLTYIHIHTTQYPYITDNYYCCCLFYHFSIKNGFFIVQLKNVLFFEILIAALADAHAIRVSSEATCRWPKPRVVVVQDDPSKLYSPHCTILHRCGDDTGCCFTNTRTCKARSEQIVVLYFYVSIFYVAFYYGKYVQITYIVRGFCIRSNE